MITFYDFYPSPLGKLLLLANKAGLIGIEFELEQEAIYLANLSIATEANGDIDSIFYNSKIWLERYFQGERLDFSHLDFLAPQGTPFQQSVWEVLRQIPYGKTLTYAEIAQKIGKPNAMRAVGGAVGRNPISIFIPCHRVLGKNQTLTGFGGGLPAKRYLLELEQIKYQDLGTEFVKPKCKKWK